MFPTEEHMLDGLATAIGMSTALTQFIHEEFQDMPHKLPTIVKYAMSITAGNMSVLTSAHLGKEIERIRFPIVEQMDNEQFEEHLRRKMHVVIEFLYHAIQEDKHNE